MNHNANAPLILPEASPRSLLDVHYKRPLGEGPRLTRADDFHFALLCPTCHRIEHARLCLVRTAMKPTDESISYCLGVPLSPAMEAWLNQHVRGWMFDGHAIRFPDFDSCERFHVHFFGDHR
jgi:hypothetical protein